MSLRLPDPGSFEDLLRPTRGEVASLVRSSRHPATEPYWSVGVYRFDDPDPGRADSLGTCYAASSDEVAFAESVIHECGRFVRGSYEVPAAVFERSGLYKLRSEKLEPRQVDDLCDRFNVTAV